VCKPSVRCLLSVNNGNVKEEKKVDKKELVKNIISIVITVVIILLLLSPPTSPPESLSVRRHPPSPPPQPAIPASKLEMEVLKILETNGTEAAFNYALETGLIKESLPPIPVNSSLYRILVETYGGKLENYPSVVGRVQLLKAMGIDARDP